MVNNNRKGFMLYVESNYNKEVVVKRHIIAERYFSDIEGHTKTDLTAKIDSILRGFATDLEQNDNKPVGEEPRPNIYHKLILSVYEGDNENVLEEGEFDITHLSNKTKFSINLKHLLPDAMKTIKLESYETELLPLTAEIIEEVIEEIDPNNSVETHEVEEQEEMDGNVMDWTKLD